MLKWCFLAVKVCCDAFWSSISNSFYIYFMSRIWCQMCKISSFACTFLAAHLLILPSLPAQMVSWMVLICTLFSKWCINLILHLFFSPPASRLWKQCVSYSADKSGEWGPSGSWCHVWPQLYSHCLCHSWRCERGAGLFPRSSGGH